MASNGKQSRSNEPKAESAFVEAPAPVETSASEAAPVAVAVPAVVPSVASDPAAGFASAFDVNFDTSQWTKKSLDMWSENATAFFDFADKVTKAKTLDEVTDLQTRFFSERLDVILRQSSELLAFAQEVMTVTVAPFYGAKAA